MTQGKPTTTTGSGLNFWQWLGIAIIVVGLAIYAWRQFAAGEETPPPRVPDALETRV